MKKINLFIICLIFFSFLIFFLKSYFFGISEDELNSSIEDKYIEPSITIEEFIKISPSLIEKKKIQNEKIKVILKSAYNIRYSYYPQNFEGTIDEYYNSFKTFLNHKSILPKIDYLKVEFHKNKETVRGKMKKHIVKLYGIEKMSIGECNSVGIHEFGHFVDLYHFKKGVFTDISYFYYNISWNSTKVMKAGQKQADFVSGYAMTNKYEDFAESFTYFILHNEDFLKKANKSKTLKKKYIFFKKQVFKNGEYIGTDFSTDNKILDYYRDITKIDFSLENFLEFLKK